MKGDEELLEAFSGIEGLLEQSLLILLKLRVKLMKMRLLEFLLVLM